MKGSRRVVVVMMLESVFVVKIWPPLNSEFFFLALSNCALIIIIITLLFKYVTARLLGLIILFAHLINFIYGRDIVYCYFCYALLLYSWHFVCDWLNAALRLVTNCAKLQIGGNNYVANYASCRTFEGSECHSKHFQCEQREFLRSILKLSS